MQPRAAGVWLGVLLSLAGAAAWSAPLSPAEQAGRRLYHEGVAASGATVTALVGAQGSPVPATILPCANCHGPDGLGRPEGGIRPPAITWDELAKPYGHDHDPAGGGSGRVHPAFDAASFARAVTMGVDPAGNRLDPAMPRYSMAASDLRDLTAYLKRIADDLDPGLGGERVRVGLLMHGPAPTQNATRAVVLEAVARGNAAGGVHGRRIELVELDGGDDGDGGDALRVALATADDRGVFAVLMPQEPPAGIDWAALAGAGGVPLLAGMAPPDGELAAGTRAYFALPGLGDELVALTQHGAPGDQGPAQGDAPAAILWQGDAAALAAVDRLEAHLMRRAVRGGAADSALRGTVARHVVANAEAVRQAVDALHARGARRVIVMLPPDALAVLMRAAEGRRWSPELRVPLRFAAPLLAELPEPWHGRVAVSMVAAPAEVGAGARAILAAARENGGGRVHPLSQLAALAGTEILLEGLKRSGRRVSRQGFADALAAMSEMPTEAGPRISYGPTRRVGAVGVHVLQLERGGRVASAQLVRLDRE